MLLQGPAKASAEVALLRSDVATLVRVVDDIRTRKRPPLTAATAQPNRPANRKTASAIAGTVIGIVASAWLWTYTRASAEQIVPQPSIVQAPVAPDPVPASAQDVKGATSATIAGPTQPPPSVQPPATTKINLPTPTNYVGTISIDGEPAGEVFIDRRSAGRTPLRVENLKAGSHLIWIESDGYRRFTRVVLVPSGRVTRLWADLEPLSTR